MVPIKRTNMKKNPVQIKFAAVISIILSFVTLLSFHANAQNIGIGTNAPGNKLHVFGGDAEIEDYYPYLYLNDTTVSGGGGKAGLTFQYNGATRAILNYDIPNDYFNLTTDNYATRNDLIVNGNGSVGIGIIPTDPFNKLHISGGDIWLADAYPFLILDNTQTNTNAGIRMRENGFNTGWLMYSGTEDVLRLTTDPNGSRNDLIVNGNGSVGIGIIPTDPFNKLHISGGDIWLADAYPFLILDNTQTNTNAGIRMKENGVNTGWLMYNGTEDVLRLTTDPNGLRNDLAISTIGKVGIGTSLPDEALHVEGTIEVDQKIQANDSGGLEFATDDGNTRMVIADDGDIGIGTTTPANGSRLHISGGDLTLDDTGPYLYLNSTTTTGNCAMVLQQTGTAKGWLIYTDVFDVLRMTTDPNGGRNDIAVNSSGNVGMGTATPGSHQLYVTSDNSGAGGASGYFENTLPGGIALSIENSSNTSSDNVLLITSQGSTGNLASFDSYHGTGTWDREFRFTNTGDGRCDGTWITGGADYAEFFPMFDPAEVLESGDVIAISDKKGYTVEKATASKNQMVLGVYSTKPAVIGNSNAEEDPENAALVGLIGVVPTKVCTENGPIRIGDFISVSSTPGIAAKALASGMMIGRALENYDGTGQGMIKVMVDVNDVSLDIRQELEALNAQVRELRDMVSSLSDQEEINPKTAFLD